jgi:hypothetical protein
MFFNHTFNSYDILAQQDISIGICEFFDSQYTAFYTDLGWTAVTGDCTQ